MKIEEHQGIVRLIPDDIADEVLICKFFQGTLNCTQYFHYSDSKDPFKTKRKGVALEPWN